MRALAVSGDTGGFCQSDLCEFGLGGLSMHTWRTPLKGLGLSPQVNNRCHDGVQRVGGSSTGKIEDEGLFPR